MFKEGIACDKEFKTRREAKECRKFHLAQERQALKTPLPTPAADPPETFMIDTTPKPVAKEEDQYEVSQYDTPSGDLSEKTVAQWSQASQD